MQYPKFLKKNGSIGLVAPSFGCTTFPYKDKLNTAIKTLKEKGYTIIEGENIWSYYKLASAPAKSRAEEFMKMYTESGSDFIMSVGGGEIMIDILPYVDFNIIETSKPKFFMGYSDNTVLTFLLTSICDVSSIYYVNAPDFGTIPWHDTVKDGFELISGNKLEFDQIKLFELDEDAYQEDLYSPYVTNGITAWYSNDSLPHIFSGRIIGGCLDILQLLCGTKYGNMDRFNDKYIRDGVIWYLETCDLNAVSTYRALLQLKSSGFFKHINGFLIGKPLNGKNFGDMSYKNAVLSVLESFNAPIIFNFNVGHVSPTIPIINGSLATVTFTDEEAKIEYKLL